MSSLSYTDNTNESLKDGLAGLQNASRELFREGQRIRALQADLAAELSAIDERGLKVRAAIEALQAVA